MTSRTPHYHIVKRDGDLRATARRLLSSEADNITHGSDGYSLSELEKLLQQITFLTEELNTSRLTAARTQERLSRAEELIWSFLNATDARGQEVTGTGTCDVNTSMTEVNELQESSAKRCQELQMQLEELQVQHHNLQVEHKDLLEKLEQQQHSHAKTEVNQDEHRATIIKLNQSYGAAVIKNNTLERQLKEARHMLVESEKRASKQLQELTDTMETQLAAKDLEIQRLISAANEAKCVTDGQKRVHFLSPIPTQSDDSIGLKPLRKAGMSVKQVTAHFLDSELIL